MVFQKENEISKQVKQTVDRSSLTPTSMASVEDFAE
jgi:hypothetical protein